MPSVYDIIAQAIGVLGMVLAFISFQCKENRRFCTYQALSGAAFAVNFFMLGSATAGMLNMLNILRSYVCGYVSKKYRTACCVGVAVLYVIATVLTIGSAEIKWLAVLVLLAQLVGTATMWLANGKILRIMQFFFTSPAWLTHNIIVFSLGGILCETFNMLSIIISFIRFGFSGFESGGKER